MGYSEMSLQLHSKHTIKKDDKHYDKPAVGTVCLCEVMGCHLQLPASIREARGENGPLANFICTGFFLHLHRSSGPPSFRTETAP